MTWFGTIALTLILAQWAAQLWLDRLNQQHVSQYSREIPDTFKEMVTPENYRKSIEYTLAKSRFHQVETTYNVLLLLLVLFSGVLPLAFYAFAGKFGTAAWAMALFLFLVAIALTLPGLPFDWYAQFRLEERFGFNTTTQRLWWIDRLKGLLLAFAFGYPLLLLLLKLIDWAGSLWWLWGWASLLAFQILMVVLAPILILPLFNKFTPLPEGSLRARLLALGEKTGFHAKTIQIMDGSKRSRHSNAFFTGFGRFRKIVLFDTLVQQLTEPELEAVLAHEIGHYKKKHIPKMMLWSAVGMLVSFYALNLLARQDWFYEAFGFANDDLAPAFLLFGLLSGTVTFWFSPLVHLWSRRYEYQADAFAAQIVGQVQSLISALRKLNEKNLSNLTPHPLYSGFYYSHPTLLEREAALLHSMKG
jgi:STE24 endopeptidase